MSVKLGELLPLQNLCVEFGENKRGYIGGFVYMDQQVVPLIFTERELGLAKQRASREQENFESLVHSVDLALVDLNPDKPQPGLWSRLVAWLRGE